jgi:dCTP deaminase
MSILCDHEIASLAHGGMISPFIEHQQGEISYGLSSFGYDIRVAPRFKVFTNVHSSIVDPKRLEACTFVDMDTYVATIPPNSFALARTVERFRMPDDVMALCVGKSTYARCGIIVNVTPLEPGWEGVLTLEISNTTPLPAKIYANEGIAQLIFFRGLRPLVTYGDRKGKYQHQVDITLPITKTPEAR